MRKHVHWNTYVYHLRSTNAGSGEQWLARQLVQSLRNAFAVNNQLPKQYLKAQISVLLWIHDVMQGIVEMPPS